MRNEGFRSRPGTTIPESTGHHHRHGHILRALDTGLLLDASLELLRQMDIVANARVYNLGVFEKQTAHTSHLQFNGIFRQEDVSH
jgi:hypothetical protein